MFFTECQKLFADCEKNPRFMIVTLKLKSVNFIQTKRGCLFACLFVFFKHVNDTLA